MSFDTVPNEILCIIIDFIPLYQRGPLLCSTRMFELMTQYRHYTNHKKRFVDSLKLINTTPRFTIRTTETLPTNLIGYSARKHKNSIVLYSEYANDNHLRIINGACILNSRSINDISLYYCIRHKRSISMLFNVCLVEFEYFATSIDMRL